jgi:hypothetical protein
MSDGAVVDRDAIREQFAAVRFVAPVQEARTFWHAIYDVDDASCQITFYRHDADGVSVYSDPIPFTLARGGGAAA